MLPVSELIPEHKLLSDSEAKKAAAKFNVRFEDFPKILESDPQVMALGAKPGQLVEIKRNDDGNKYSYYRYVVKG